MYSLQLLAKKIFLILPTLGFVAACVSLTEASSTPSKQPDSAHLFPITEAVGTYTSKQKGIHVTGTKVWLQPPSGFTVATNFPGFQQVDTNSSIMISEIPGGPIMEVTKGMTAENFAKRGMNLIETYKVLVNDRTALLMELTQHAYGADYSKWMLVLGDASTTITVVGTYPSAIKSALSEQIKAAVLTTVWDKTATVGLFDGLSFKVGETDELKPVKRIGNMIAFSRAGEFGTPGAAKPKLIVGTAISDQAIADVAVFSKQRILYTAQAEEITVTKENNITVDGIVGYELIASAQDAVEETPIFIYQVIVPFKSNYLIIQGLVGQSIAEQYLPQFRQLTNSVTLMH